MSTVVLRGGVELANPLDPALDFLDRYGIGAQSRTASFDKTDLRRANGGGARISAVEQEAILGRRRKIERALREIDPHVSLAARSIPWGPLAGLFDAFADLRGVGFSKMTKALHPKRPALVPMLDSVVQAYLPAPDAESFGQAAVELVRSYKEDLDRNRAALREAGRELGRRGYELTAVRLLDILIWSASEKGAY